MDLLLPVRFECVEAEHGLEALQKARARRPDVILLDWFMPIMNGFETIRQLRQDPALADVVVVAVSASAFEVDQARCLSAGCQAFLSKPVDARRLFQELEIHLKLEWLYQECGADDATQALRPESSCVFPPRDEVKRLHELVLRGDLFGIQKRAAALAQDDTTFQPFAAQVTHLASAYQDEQLLAFLERCLEEECN
jgi:CheY-like chemotaxis protein